MPSPDSPPDPGGSPTSPRTRVLVVDDDEAVRRIGVRMLEACGHAAEGAWDGASALAALRRPDARFDAAVVDLGLPDMSADEVVAAIAAAAPGLPVVGTSGRAPGTALALAAFVAKPFTVAALSAAVAKVVAARAPDDR